ncbi:tubulin polyglutamylase TTLL13-like isoform X2 [Toxorhynchites rutilus septentrionalis]|uniref:tubulin polyglutamylase TTLL13-like isoform X2 n=1 Tax=Toxorhynchites rutilus septentrionalis TaxID=329112 RepID=UPI00247978A8|nr:tubulin polyglutamylase TTLL13-like isoform X2 [Toxorhynchites rutilus septentrionalis]
MLPRRDISVKSAKLAKRKSSSEDESSDEGTTSSGSTDGSSSSSESESEMDTTETSFSSKSPVECVGSSKQQGLLKVNQRSYAVFCDGGKNSKSFCSGNTELGEEAKRDHKPPISICILNSRYDIIPRICRRLGYKLVGENEHWNVCWTDSLVGVDFCRDMRRFQKINHFPGMFEICRKDLLARNLSRMMKMFPTEYQIFPKTWVFPADLGEAIAYSRTHRSKTYILKPDQGSQGRGIFLTKNLKEINPRDRMICQVYIHRPLLIDGYKFDLRVYTLVTSTDPLRIFVYKEGLARFATNKYREPCITNTSNNFMHLTNYSVNKYSRCFSNDDEAGSKRRFATLNRILTSEGYDIAELWSNIDDVIVKTILSAWQVLRHTYQASFPTHDIIQACFEILGFDILIDHRLKPYILEVNHSPSFHTDEAIDREIKEALIHDTFVMLNLNGEVKKRVLDEDKRRIQNRLLQRLREYSKCKENSKESSSDSKNGDDDDPNSEERPGPWAEQITWEETHLGGFRRILPAPGDPDRYAHLFLAQTQASVYNETAASKKREECAKQQRIELEERYKHNQAMLNKNNPKGQPGSKPLCSGEDGAPTTAKKQMKKRKPKVIPKKDDYSPDYIPDYEERERLALLAQRDFLIRTCGLVQNIYLNFNRNKLLTVSDQRKYKEVFSKLIANDLLQNELSSQQANQSSATTCLPVLSNHHGSHSQTSQRMHLKSLVTINETASWMQCTEVLPPSRPPLPYLLASQPTNYRSTKSTMARQVTNVVKRHSMDARQMYSASDKVI